MCSTKTTVSKEAINKELNERILENRFAWNRVTWGAETWRKWWNRREGEHELLKRRRDLKYKLLYLTIGFLSSGILISSAFLVMKRDGSNIVFGIGGIVGAFFSGYYMVTSISALSDIKKYLKVKFGRK
ncbi:MAG: hypothetical protein GY797_38270 [Deltaproteobacteria bacterium]|nr:hypothetical protein [Deltaproteobacteria bacterium]